MTTLDETHSPHLRSWVAAANEPTADFPIQNLPHGVFRPRGSALPWRGGVAIGDQVLDMAAAHAAGLFAGEAAESARHAGAAELNGLMALGPAAWRALRLALSRGLRETTVTPAAAAGRAGGQAVGEAAEASALRARWQACLMPLNQIEMAVPARIGDYTDMYTSVYHATNIGKLFRPDNPLTPNFKWMPIGYHGRVSSIGVSGQTFPRPRGQILPPGASAPVFSECQRLDYELELGIWVGQGNTQGDPVPLADAERHLFGLCLLNDWSARDIQSWEYQPLGPFLGKNFATTISPWIVTMAALAPYRCAWERPADDPAPLPYLDSAEERAQGALDITLESWIESVEMRAARRAPARLSQSTFRHAYWTIGQMLVHHTVGGCNLQPGDLIGTGTQSGPTATEAAALIELSVGGKRPVTLDNGEVRSFLADGDEVILKAWCERPGWARIGFGECRGRVLPAR